MIAATQAAGRGQWGRQWSSDRGGLYLSLALQPDLPIQAAGQLTLASAWGIATSLRNLGVPIQVKWPNDLVAKGQKLGGLLTETRIEQDVIKAVVIGVGLNWKNPVPPTGITLENLVSPDQPCPALENLETVAAVVLYGLWQGYLYWQGQGTAVLLSAYQALLTNLGQVVTVNGHPVTVKGVTELGNLQVQPVTAPGQNAKETLELQPGTISLGYNASV